MAPYDIYVNRGYGWFGDNRIANDFSIISGCAVKNRYVFPLRFSRLFRNPLDVGRHLAKTLQLFEENYAYVTVELDFCCRAANAQLFAQPVSQLLTSYGFDRSHDVVLAVENGQCSDVLFLTVTISCPDQWSPSVAIHNITASTRDDDGVKALLLKWFSLSLSKSQEPLTKQYVEKLIKPTREDTVYLSTPIAQLTDAPFAPDVFENIRYTALTSVDCSSGAANTSVPAPYIDWSIYREGSVLYVEFECNLLQCSHVMEGLRESRLLVDAKDVSVGVYGRNDTRHTSLEVNSFEPYWREMRRMIMIGARALSDHLTPFALLYILDMLPLMWAFSRYHKMAHLERCYTNIRNIRLAREPSNKERR